MDDGLGGAVGTFPRTGAGGRRRVFVSAMVIVGWRGWRFGLRRTAYRRFLRGATWPDTPFGVVLARGWGFVQRAGTPPGSVRTLGHGTPRAHDRPGRLQPPYTRSAEPLPRDSERPRGP